MNRIISIQLILLSILSVGCNKFLNIDPPIDQLATKVVFSDSTSAESSIVGLYSNITKSATGFLYGRVSIAAGLSSDEIYRGTANITYDEFSKNTISINNSENLSCWREAYSYIYHINSVIENLQNASALSTIQRNRGVSEMKVMRAFTYFYLINLYGDVPLVLTTDYTKTESLLRTDIEIVYDQVLKDLNDAQEYFDNTAISKDKTRCNKWFCNALKARIYLYRRDWSNAIAQSTVVINSGMFKLTSLDSAFLLNNQEAIMQLIPSAVLPYNSSEGYNFIPASSTVIPTYPLQSPLLNAFETGDQRKLKWVKSNVNSGTNYYYPYKYKVATSSPNTLKYEYENVFRLSELYLIRAEALAQQNNLAAALPDLNIIRARAGLSNILVSDPLVSNQAGMLSTIMHERQIEFFSEWGHRWFDLKRTRKINEVLPAVKDNSWKPTAQLFPIPEAEILVNPKLIQNEGY